jgi:hypothetical protein
MVRSMAKSPLAVAKEAYEVGKQALPAYSCKNSRKDFTQAQLFAMLVMRQYFGKDYRSVMQWLKEWRDLREVLELEKVPHWTTLEKAQKRLIKKGRSTESLEYAWVEPASVA